MINEVAKILSDGLGPQNVAAAAIDRLIVGMGPEKVTSVEALLATAVWLSASWVVLWGSYVGARGGGKDSAGKSSRRQSYMDWLVPRAGTVALRFAAATAVSWLVFFSPLVPWAVEAFIHAFVYDGKNHAGLSFLFAYNEDSPLFKLYRTGAWLIAATLGITAAGAYSFHYGAYSGEPVNVGTKELLDLGKVGRRAATAFIICLVAFFTVIPELAANWALSLFSDKTVQSLVVGDSPAAAVPKAPQK